MVERVHDDDIKKRKTRKKLIRTVHIISRIAKKIKKTPSLRRSKKKINGLNVRRHYQYIVQRINTGRHLQA